MGRKEYFLPGLCLSSERLVLVLCGRQYPDAPLAGPGQKKQIFLSPGDSSIRRGLHPSFPAVRVNRKFEGAVNTRRGGEGSEASSSGPYSVVKRLFGGFANFCGFFFSQRAHCAFVLLFSSLPG